MLNMPQIQDIRDIARDRSVASIARSVSVDEKTVRRYLKQDDFSPRPPEKGCRPSRLDAHKELIDTWLREDESRWYKQRHTAKRIYEGLRRMAEDFIAHRDSPADSAIVRDFVTFVIESTRSGPG